MWKHHKRCLIPFHTINLRVHVQSQLIDILFERHLLLESFDANKEEKMRKNYKNKTIAPEKVKLWLLNTYGWRYLPVHNKASFFSSSYLWFRTSFHLDHFIFGHFALLGRTQTLQWSGKHPKPQGHTIYFFQIATDKSYGLTSAFHTFSFDNFSFCSSFS